jgi:transcription termination factor Rho
MSDTIELNDKLVSELRVMAKSMGISEADELRKPQLIIRINEQYQLIEQARAQQSALSSNYSEINHNTSSDTDTATADGTENDDDKPRSKRARSIKSKKETTAKSTGASYQP